jgi:putative protease
MIQARPIELLAPAKDLTCGLEAVKHGADAVYIGAPRFGARAAAGNSLEDIRALCDFAHLYDVRVYVALNTILKDEELKEAETLICRLYDVGADALIVQDMGITQLDIPPIPLHASTQTDNCTPGKVEFLYRTGFTQIVLARELTLEEIQTIAARTPDATLEAFVHGALCVSYSGRCYLSAALSGRSANRGECAQYCRLPYTLVDTDGRTIIEKKHLLSLKDMNRADELEALIRAGVSALKIEGRLKETSYVKNVVAYYRQRLDRLFAKNPAFYRPSSGHSSYAFKPQSEKSFNRGFTTYFLHGREAGITSFDTPKSMGEPIGTVKEVKRNSFTVAGLKPVHNGDGLAFFNIRGELEGFRANRVEDNRIFPQIMPFLKPQMPLYRNYDHVFESALNKPSAERKIDVIMEWSDYPEGFALSMTEAPDAHEPNDRSFHQSVDVSDPAIGRRRHANDQAFDAGVVVVRPFEKEIARKPQDENIRAQLDKLGNTPFNVVEIRISMMKNYFVPSSVLSEMRREATESLIADRRNRYRRRLVESTVYDRPTPYPQQNLDYTANVSNEKAACFYKKHGVKTIEPAFEIEPPSGRMPLMYTKHCLRYSLGWCPVLQKNKSPFREPFFLLYKDVKLYLSFDCLHCRMLIYKQ